jgi:tetraacyldisaccharide 4'-kinase
MRPDAARRLAASWYAPGPPPVVLRGAARVFGAVVAARRHAYARGWFRTHRLGVPVVVVGNLTVGGTGKTPVVDWLVRLARREGLHPGVVSRGYGARHRGSPRLLTSTDTAADVGDEPLLLHRRLQAPVCVGMDRVAAARQLVATGVNLVIGDDGLQHYRLARDLEIAVVDGERRFGNGWLLPAGPLREPLARLASADLVLVNGGVPQAGEYGFQARITTLRALHGTTRQPLSALAGQRVQAVAGIGNPARFHAMLRAAGLLVEEVPVDDHGVVDLAALLDSGGSPIVMTEKDAVKYPPRADARVWVAELELQMPAAVEEQCAASLRALRS